MANEEWLMANLQLEGLDALVMLETSPCIQFSCLLFTAILQHILASNISTCVLYKVLIVPISPNFLVLFLEVSQLPFPGSMPLSLGCTDV